MKDFSCLVVMLIIMPAFLALFFIRYIFTDIESIFYDTEILILFIVIIMPYQLATIGIMRSIKILVDGKIELIMKSDILIYISIIILPIFFAFSMKHIFYDTIILILFLIITALYQLITLGIIRFMKIFIASKYKVALNIKHNILIIILIIILPVLFSMKYIFSYAIISIPYEYGTMTYLGGSKHFFPICIVNPIKARDIKKDIVYYLENAGIPDNYHRAEELRAFFASLENLSGFDIISFNADAGRGFEEEPEESFLLQAKNSDKQCVVYRNIKTKILTFAI